jgi:Zn-dependent M28 family amino/carboxypeptidase
MASIVYSQGMEKIMTIVEYLGVSNTFERQRKLIKYLEEQNISYFFQENDEKHLKNIIVPAKNNKNGIITLTAHIDVVPKSNGFNDNTSGVVSLLLLIKNKFDNVEIVFTDREETGFVGAEEYLEETKNILMNINVDVVGLEGFLFADVKNFQGNQIIKFLMSKDCKFGFFPPNDSFMFLYNHIPNITFSTGPYSDYYQTVRAICSSIHNAKHDNDITLISEKSIQKTADTILHVLDFVTKKQ